MRGVTRKFVTSILTLSPGLTLSAAAKRINNPDAEHRGIKLSARIQNPLQKSFESSRQLPQPEPLFRQG